MTLKERRVALGLTQEEVARKLDVVQTAVSRWEVGDNKPLKKYQKKLAKLYGCTIEELMSAEEKAGNHNDDVLPQMQHTE